jgi:hypothetical protein
VYKPVLAVSSISARFQYKRSKELIGRRQVVERCFQQLPFKFGMRAQMSNQPAVDLLPQIAARQVWRKKQADSIAHRIDHCTSLAPCFCRCNPILFVLDNVPVQLAVACGAFQYFDQIGVHFLFRLT